MMKNKLLVFMLFNFTTVSNIVYAKVVETTCYTAATPKNAKIYHGFIDKNDRTDLKKSYEAISDSILVKHMHSKEYSDNGSTDRDDYTLEIRVSSMGKHFTTYQISRMDDGSFSMDEDGGSDISLVKDQNSTKISIPDGARLYPISFNNAGRIEANDNEEEVSDRFISLVETKQPLDLINVSCSEQDLK